MQHILSINEFSSSTYQDSINEGIIYDKIKDIYFGIIKMIPKSDESDIENDIEKMSSEEKVNFIKSNLDELKDVTISKTISDIINKISPGSLLTKLTVMVSIIITMQSCGTQRWTPACHKVWKIQSSEMSSKYPTRSHRR